MSNKVNFAEDLKSSLRDYFQKFGIDFYDPEADRSTYSPKLKDWVKKNKRKVDEDKSQMDHLLIRQYVNFTRKFIPVCPRKVKFSSKVKGIKVHHPERKVINLLAEKFRTGENINPFLSKGLLCAYDEDQLHATWRMYHLHVNSKKTQHHYFMDRAGKLLMVFIHGDTAYFLDVRLHKETDEENGMNVVWSRQELLHILTNEFPDVIANYKLNGVLPPNKEEALTDTQLETLKRKGVNPIYSSGDLAIAPMGGGIATNGSSVEVTMHSDQIRRMIYDWEKYLSENESSLREDFKRHGHEVTEFRFRLSRDDHGFFVYEELTNARLPSLTERRYFTR